MKIHECQARTLMADAGVPVPPSEVVSSANEVPAAYSRIGAKQIVVKAQVHAGGRGKAGYVKLVSSADEAKQHAERMLREPMVSNQTGPEGVQVRKVLLAGAVDIDHEYYLGVVLDRARRVPVLMASAEGGVEIEEVAAKNRKRSAKRGFIRISACRSFRRRRSPRRSA